MSGLICYSCKEEFQDNDLAIPMNFNVILPYGTVHLTVFQHYICGLNYYLNDLENISDLYYKDKQEIVAKLMAVIQSMEKDSTKQ